MEIKIVDNAAHVTAEGIVLADPAVSNSVHPFMGTVQWNGNADLCPDTVCPDSVKI